MEAVVFYILGTLAVATAVLVVTRRNPIASAVWLVACFFAFAALFVTLQAHFIAVIQILLYAGAIMVLFIFVIMLLNLGAAELKARMLRFPVILGGAATLYLIVLLVLGILKRGTFPSAAGDASALAVASDFGYVGPVGQLLFTKYLLPFELTSVLLLLAIVGSVVMGKRKL